MALSEPKTRKGEIARLILGIVGVTGIVLVGAVAPNLLQLLPLKSRSRFSYNSIYQSVEKLKHKGWLKTGFGKNGQRLELTDTGRAELLAWELGQKRLKKPWRWDKKWRVLIFDIPESRKKVREQVRHTLRELGFRRLQDSVWVYPYECEEVLELLRTKYGIRHQALYLRVDRIAKDSWLRRLFSLT